MPLSVVSVEGPAHAACGEPPGNPPSGGAPCGAHRRVMGLGDIFLAPFVHRGLLLPRPLSSIMILSFVQGLLYD